MEIREKFEKLWTKGKLFIFHLINYIVGNEISRNFCVNEKFFQKIYAENSLLECWQTQKKRLSNKIATSKFYEMKMK